MGKQQHWNPPIVMLIGRGQSPSIVKSVQENLSQIFDKVLDNKKHYVEWTKEYYEDPEEDFQTTILEIIGEYYEATFPEHSILRSALRLLWFEYLLLNKYTVPESDVATFERHIEARRPLMVSRSAPVIPDIINRFLKAIVLPQAMEAAKSLTKNLHDRLFRMTAFQKTTRTDSDLILCMLFVLMMFLGRTQHALMLLARTPTDEIDMKYNHENAVAKIKLMEAQVSGYFNDFHCYALQRKSQKLLTTLTEPNTAAERHAIEFDLVNRLRTEVQEYYGKHGACSPDLLWSDYVAVEERPDSLKVEDYTDLDAFKFLNVRRLCWKVFMDVEKYLC
jgi:hypothetical protein